MKLFVTDLDGTLVEYNNITDENLKNEFANSGVAINQLVGNGGLPNDKGYGLYIKAVTKHIESSMN